MMRRVPRVCRAVPDGDVTPRELEALGRQLIEARRASQEGLTVENTLAGNQKVIETWVMK